MLTGQIRNQIDHIWNACWTGGMTNPLTVIEQITYLIFIERLDSLQSNKENKAQTLGRPLEKTIFPSGNDPKGEPYQNLRWSRFKNMAPDEMFRIVKDHVFPFIRTLGKNGSSYSQHMQGAQFGFPTPNLLVQIVELLSHIDMSNRDTNGDLYEYMLSKIATSKINGQFRTPRHIIHLIVALRKPVPTDTICDPAAGTCGFLVGAGEYLRKIFSSDLFNKDLKEHFYNHMFHGFDSDTTMLRIGAMNMALHGVPNADISYRDSLSEEYSEDTENYSLILANPPFKGTVDKKSLAKNLLAMNNTKQSELLFLALFLRLLKNGGRAAVIVPAGVLFNTSKAHTKIRKILVEEHQLEAVINLPSGIFKPYAGVTTAILLFTKTSSGGTQNVWFYDVQSDGYSLDDKRSPLLSDNKLGVTPQEDLTGEELKLNNLPDILHRWNHLEQEKERSRKEQSFFVPKKEIVEKDYILDKKRYQEFEEEEIHYPSPQELIADIQQIDDDIKNETDALKKLLPSSHRS